MKYIKLKETVVVRRSIVIELSQEDFEILDKYGFHYARNFEEQAKDIANQLRQVEREEGL